MRRIVAVVVVVVISIVAGCTSSTTTRAPAYPLLDHGDREAEISLHGGEVVEARIVGVTNDGVAIADPDPYRRATWSIGYDRIERVRYVSRGRGALQGLLYGTLFGALAGALIGAAGADDCDDCWSAGRTAALGATIVGINGMWIGPLVGAIRGKRTVYRIAR